LLGLRDSDIVSLRFDNFDWENCRISIIQRKTGEPLLLPLLPAIGEAIIDYLRYGRPVSNSNFVFVKHVPPFNELVTFYHVADKNMEAAGIEGGLSTKRGMHTFRHTLASRLIQQGESYETASAVLGHIDSSSIDVYTHVDADGLLMCALERSEICGYV
jgi:integrase